MDPSLEISALVYEVTRSIQHYYSRVSVLPCIVFILLFYLEKQARIY